MAALALACVVLLAVATGAQAYVYWTNYATGSIGRANLDGSGVDQNFITGLPGPGQVAVDHAHVYWTNGYSIGRANLDGSGKNINFISGLSWGAGGVAIYHMKKRANCEDVELHWTNAVDNAVGHATAPGCSCPGPAPCVKPSLIAGVPDTTPLNVAVAPQNYVETVGSSGHLYWTYVSSASNNLTGFIGRANLDGSGVNQSFITTAAQHTPEGVAADSQHVYWSNAGIRDLFPGSIGRANLDGSGVDQNYITGASQPESVAVDGEHVYWANHDSNSVGRANLDGSGVNQNFITGASEPWGIAVDDGGATETTLACKIATVWNWGCNATVTGHGRMAPRGTVTFTAPGGNLSANSCTLSGSGTSASCQIYYSLPITATGTYTLTAAYSGDGFNAASNTSLPFVIGSGPPQLTKVTQSATRWRAGNALPHTARATPPLGTTFAFTLKRPARVWFFFTYRTVGRRVGGRCVAQTNANRGRRRCLRTVRVAFSRPARAGRTRLRFDGRVTRKRKLPPGRYKLSIAATANGRWSKPATLRFTILPTAGGRTR